MMCSMKAIKIEGHLLNNIEKHSMCYVLGALPVGIC